MGVSIHEEKKTMFKSRIYIIIPTPCQIGKHSKPGRFDMHFCKAKTLFLLHIPVSLEIM